MLITCTKLFIRELRWRMLWLFLLMLFAAVAEGIGISMILPLLQTDSGIGDDQLSRILQSLFVLIGMDPTIISILSTLVAFFFIRSVFLLWQASYLAKVVSDHLVQMRSRTISALFRSRYQYVMEKDIGFLTNAITTEIEKVNFSLRQMASLMVYASTSIIYLTLPLLFQPIITGFLIGISIPVIAMMMIVNRMTRAASTSHTLHSGRQQNFLVEALSHAKYLMATGRSNVVVDRVLTETRLLGSRYRRLMTLSGIARYGFEPFIVIGLALVILYYTQLQGRMIGEILFLLFLYRTAAVNLLSIQPAYRSFLDSSGSLQLYRDLSQELSNSIEPTGTVNVTNASQEISVDNVSFKYHTGRSQALTDVTITIPSHKTIAIVGPSGSGKSTLANLITGILRPETGEVYLGPTPYDALNLTTLRGRIGYVTQEAVVFNASITDNITFWEPEHDQEKLETVIQQTQLHSIVEQWEEVEQGRLGDAGRSVSGGERQRIAIARELYRNFDILILDEATSSMDTALEREIDAILLHERGMRTILIIAHRLSTVKSADTIYVLNEGRVAESGPFEELYEQHGLFRDMVDLQKL